MTKMNTRGRDLNHVAYLYDPLIEFFSFGREKQFRKLTLACMEPFSDEHILDIGCGTGSLTLLAAAKMNESGSIVGIDAAPRMIDIARKKAERAEVKASFQVAVAEKLPFADNSFTMVVNSMFCHHIDRELKIRAFAEMHRVLQKGGILVTADIDRPSTLLGKITGWAGRWLLWQSELEDNLRGQLPQLIRKAGFTNIDRYAHVHGLISFYTAQKEDKP